MEQIVQMLIYLFLAEELGTGTGNPLPSASPKSSSGQVCEASNWPDLDHGLVCGDCKALINKMSSKYITCNNYCETIGRRCSGAWEEWEDSCNVKSIETCDHQFNYTSDALCKCGPTLSSGQVCDTSSWPDLDHGLVCGDCKALINKMSSKYITCNNYCETIGRRCSGAWEESGDTCNVESIETCDHQFTYTSDALCKCGSTLPSILSGPNGTRTWGETCSKPCSGQLCGKVGEIMRSRLDFSLDPCEDFFAFACNSKNRGNRLPIVKIETVDFNDLVKFPPKGFEYVNKFYKSCTKINTGYTTEEVFAKCFEDGSCSEEEIQSYGVIFAEFLNYTYQFLNTTMLPAVTLNWEELTKDMFGGKGWNWWDFAALKLREHFFLNAFQTVEKAQVGKYYDIFRSNVFFTPMMDTVTEHGSLDVYPTIHIVPISIHNKLRNGDKNYLSKYRALMKKFFAAFGGDSSTIDEDVEKIVDMELQIGKINTQKWFSSEFHDNYDYEALYNASVCADDTFPEYEESAPYLQTSSPNNQFVLNFSTKDFEETVTIEELSKLVPSVEWKDYIEVAFSHNPEFEVKKGQLVKIPSRKLMQRMGNWVATLSKRDQANLLIWRMFITFANDFMHTGADDGDLQEDLFQETLHKSHSRSENCIAQIKTFFPFAHDDMFIAKYVDESTKKGIIAMFEGLVTEFEKIIVETDWISRKTQSHAKEKLKAMKIIVGELSPKTMEFKELKDKMSSQEYIRNILAIGKYSWDTISMNIHKAKKIKVFSAETVNAYYSPKQNEMEILTGIINELLVTKGLSPNIPRALIYGAFGTLLGHEMLHGFDNYGRKFDKDGLRFNWWEPSEDQTFMEKTQCLMDRYANFTILHEGIEYQIPCAAYPPGENIADNGAMKAAYRSYQKLPEDQKKCMPDPDLPFTSDQLFWLGNANMWCTSDYEDYNDYASLLSTKPDSAGHYPAPWRVNTVLANQPEFAAAFKCVVGSRLNPRPEERCTVW